MPRFEYDVYLTIQKKGKITLDAPSSEQADDMLNEILSDVDEAELELVFDEIHTYDTESEVSEKNEVKGEN